MPAAVLGDSQVKLNSVTFKKLYTIGFSDGGSNQRDKEEKTIYCFELFLRDLEEDIIPDLFLEGVPISSQVLMPFHHLDLMIALSFPFMTWKKM